MPHNIPPFGSRESYLLWRTQWRRQYRKLSREIRFAKNALKQGQRAHTGIDPGKVRAELEKLRAKASYMLMDRQFSKAQAGRLRAERLALPEAA